MPILDWIGKDKVINHHLDVPYHVLERQYSFDSDGQHEEDNGSENMIIHGDNLLALKSLLPRYEGRIKCIYIDPPYNTGNEGWIYNDNVNDPRILKWMGEVVGKEGEDLSRHDKWLCMMYPRLKLLQRLLSPDGVIFISIGDDENAALKFICNEIFGESNFVDTIIWQKVYTLKNSAKYFSGMHDYILVYAKNKSSFERNLLPRTDQANSNYSNPDNDPRGDWTTNAIQARNYYSAGHYEIISPNGQKYLPPAGTSWRISEESFKKLEDDNRIWWGLNGDSVPRIKKFLSEAKNGIIPSTLWDYKFAGQNADAKNEVRDIFDNREDVFNTPKPSKLIERILQIATNKDSIILDSFAGSGTTAHAVLNMNKADEGNRKFILIEMEDYADSITAERVKRVINGYSKDIDSVLYDTEITLRNIGEGEDLLEEAKAAEREARESDEYKLVHKPKIEEGHLIVTATKKASEFVQGTGGDFSYYELGDTLMKDGELNEEVGVDKIREYVYFTETKSEPCKVTDEEPYLLGIHYGTAYYFYYERNHITTLNRDFLHTIHISTESYVIYADQCTLSDDELDKYHIDFKKIPRDISKL